MAVLAPAVVLPVCDLVVSYSALAGGMVSVVSNAFFAFRLFDNGYSWEPGILAANVYRGIIGKILLTVAMFAVFLALLRPVSAVAFFAAYFLVQVSPIIFASLLKKA